MQGEHGGGDEVAPTFRVRLEGGIPSSPKGASTNWPMPFGECSGQRDHPVVADVDRAGFARVRTYGASGGDLVAVESFKAKYANDRSTLSNFTSSETKAWRRRAVS